MQPLKPLEISLSGKNLIQASAGTGKTWTISLLYVRLIVEKQLTVEQILVVTYTRAATEELRSRIRARLKDALRAYQSPQKEHAAEYLQLLQQYPPNAERIWFLQRALLGFDEAAVFTIHGFCQRVLQQHAFEVGLPFESELIDNEYELQLSLTDQFWQQRLVKPNTLDADLLRQHTLSPDKLLADISKFIGKPYLQVIRSAVISEADYVQAKKQFTQRLEPLVKLWHTQKQQIAQLLHSGALNKQNYKPEQINKMLLCAQDFFKGYESNEIRKALAKLSEQQLKTKTNKGQQTPEHPFFKQMDALLPAYDALCEIRENALDQLRYDLLHWLRTQLPERKRQAGLLAFDDLLISLQNALLERPLLAEQLRQQYPVALIDEFQDTDPVQYKVFETIYQGDEGQLYYVGDPKQAIYGFRGADIHTYLQAAASIEGKRRYTLDKNFRSQARLLEAFNQLYLYSPDPFRNQCQIDYEAVTAGGLIRDELVLPDGLAAPLRIWNWDGSQNNQTEPSTKQNVIQQVAAAVADDIAQRLLNGQQHTASIQGQPIHSGDFAILVRSHRQGRIIKQALQERGIASVQQSTEGIFQTHEAEELQYVLAAVAEPSDTNKIRRALSTELLGYTAQDLLHLELETVAFDLELEAFYYWHQLWRTQGFMRMFRAWLSQREVRKRLLTYVDGERRLTNLLHLGELIHRETRKCWPSMQATLRWLRRCANVDINEEQQLRLESDENLVKIVTIHKSKGLQYPIVYCPFLWAEKIQHDGKAWFTWHDDTQNLSCLQASKAGLEQAKARQLEETLSENLRLLYVALTRAQYHCTVAVATGEIKGFNYASSLSWLLFGHLENSKQLLATKTASKLSATERQQIMQQALDNLVISSNNCIACEPLPYTTNPIVYHSEQHEHNLQARQFQHRLPAPVRIGSFSSLTIGKHDERPDYDQVIELYHSANSLVPNLQTFPSGRRAGVCLHKMLEELDFCKPLEAQRESVILSTLQMQGFDAAWAATAEQLLIQTLNTPLRPDKPFCLADIPCEARLDELEFYFPVENLKLERLQKVLHYYLPENWQAIHRAIDQLSFTDLKGFMKGYIDLVFLHEGQFYIVDYKSNYLGAQAHDYTTTVLHQTMAEAHYYLQYLIYSLALHRYLEKRLGKAYQWQKQVGGVFYLFLRGMGQAETAAEAQNGIFFHQPPEALINALDGLMQLE